MSKLFEHAVVTADIHLGVSNDSIMLDGIPSKTMENYEVLQSICMHARENEIPTVIVNGDLYDRAKPQYYALYLFSKLINEFSDLSFILNLGNHVTSTHHKVSEIMRSYKNVEVIDWPFVDGQVAWIPFVPELEDEQGREKLKQEIDITGKLVLGHYPVYGCTLNNGTTYKGAGIDVSFLGEPKMELLGDIHKPQQFKKGNHQVVYCGSPTASDRSEKDQDKRFFTLSLRSDGSYDLTSIPIEQKTYVEITSLKDMLNIKVHERSIILLSMDEDLREEAEKGLRERFGDKLVFKHLVPGEGPEESKTDVMEFQEVKDVYDEYCQETGRSKHAYSEGKKYIEGAVV